MDGGYKRLVRTFWSYARSERRSYWASLVLMGLTLVFDLSRPFVLKWGLDAIGVGDISRLQRLVIVFLVLVIAEYIARSGFNYLLSIAYLKTITRIRQALFDHVLQLKAAYFDKEPVGRVMTRTISDTESLGESLRAGIATIVVDILTIVGVLVVMVRLDLGLSVVMFLSVPIVYFAVRWCGLKIREKYLIVRRALAQSNGFMAEGLSGVEILQLFRQQEQSYDTYCDINRKYRRATILSNVYDASLYAFISAIAAFTSAAILVWGVKGVFGFAEVSVLIVYLNLIDRIYIPIRDLSSKFTVIQQALAALQRICDLLFTQARIPQGERVIPDRDLTIAFEDVRFAYNEGGTDVLKDISFSVNPGQVVALVGQTGSGKSTIGKLLTRSYGGYRGHIRVGGLELKDVNFHSLRSKVAVVHQDFEIFPGTLRDNITMFNPDIDDDRVREAIRLVKADGVVAQLEGELDFELREDGGNLSMGQLQLIVFARALAHDTPIILMDEATASVDSLTEKWIQEALKQIFALKTVIVVAHRLSTIQAADEIIVLDQGRVVQQGDHATLAKLEGPYARLLRSDAYLVGR